MLESNTACFSGPAADVPRLGQISFINCLPIALPLETGHIGLDAQVSYGSPARLNSALTGGELDLSAVSSYFYLSSRDEHEPVPGLSISCDGAVGSVLLFSKIPLDKLSGARIAVPDSSATSINLLKILLKDELNVVPCLEVEPQPDITREGTAAVLLIGDQALKADELHSSGHSYCSQGAVPNLRVDLGQWWNLRTGLPMVFGLYVARKQWLKTKRQAFAAICRALNNARDLGLTSLFPLVAAEAGRRTGLSADRLKRYYFNELSFQLSERHWQGLEHYEKLCRKYALI